MRRRSGVVWLPVIAIALATAVLVALAGGADAFWLCLPSALLCSALCRTRTGVALSTATVIALAIAPAVASPHRGARPALALVLLVPAASVAVLVAVRERLGRERDALRHFALTDALTGIANRRSLLARIEYEIARHTRARRRFAVLMLDLDGFKVLNDRFGHAAGDDLLRDVAAAMRRSIRSQDTVARLGGDEFCVLAPETDLPGTGPLTARIARAVSDVTAGVERLRASYGVALFPDDGDSAASLLHAADQRLLDAKREQHRNHAARRAA